MERLFFICTILLVLAFVFVGSTTQFEQVTFMPRAFGSFVKPFEEGRVLFLGDIMLARGVENIMEREGATYPFSSIGGLLQVSDLVVANFEGVVPEMHKKTESMKFAFSIQDTFMSTLQTAGVSVLSLANNHAYDFDKEGIAHTRMACEENELVCIGDPLTPLIGTTSVQTVGDTRIGILAIQNVTTPLDEESVQTAISTLRGKSDMVVVFIHWGEEYELVHNKAQERFAHLFINSGADAVIGHHPHVVQDIELYNNKPIFYSLGNFIFDQYFSDEVQEGFMLELSIEKDSYAYTLIPITSIDSPSKPTLMTGEDRRAFLDELLSRSTTSTKHLFNGETITIPRQ